MVESNALGESRGVSEGIRNFKAVLPKNGDYTVEVLQDSATEDEITVNVNIDEGCYRLRARNKVGGTTTDLLS